MDKLLLYVNSGNEKFPYITAFMAHLIFEKIHPFLDGNGRVGRLLIFEILIKKDCLFKVNIVLEEYLDTHKDEYYFHLDRGLGQPEDYLVFMLEAFYRQSEKLKRQITVESEKKQNILLPPRQEEIFNIIRDHKTVSFDTVRRRFLKVPQRTLRYDLKKLQEKGIVTKIGVSRGSYYTVKR